MKKVTLDEVVGLDRYEEMRPQFRRKVIDLKKARRVTVGDRVTFVFENHDTMLFQVQEILRAERIVDLDRIREEIDVYNDLVPDPGELSATMLIEITDSDRVRDDLLSLIGIHETVRLEIGNDTGGGRLRIPAEFEPGHSREDRISAVQYVRFKLDTAAQRAFADDAQPVRLVIDHLNYRYGAPIEGAVRRSLVADLAP